jgi:uncharacterized protein (UPF0335 family)
MTLRNEAREKLKSYIERIERLAEERKELGDEQRALFAEAKADGFDPKAMRNIIKRRQKDAGELAAADAIDDTYMHALGMAADNPLHLQIAALARDGLARDGLIEALQQLVPINGEIIARVGGEPMRLWRTEDGKSFAEPYVAPETKPAEKAGRGLGRPATVLSIVKDDPVKAAADRAEKRSRRRDQEPADTDDDETEPAT